MAVGEQIHDPLLGALERGEGLWVFTAGPLPGWPVEGFIVPSPDWDPLGEPTRSGIRACLDWIRQNEPAIRARIAAEMFNRWRASHAERAKRVRTPAEFAAAIKLEQIGFHSDGSARLVYDDGGLVRGAGIWISVGPNGEFASGPEVPD
jgi:hypothetical protein